MPKLSTEYLVGLIALYSASEINSFKVVYPLPRVGLVEIADSGLIVCIYR